jgi:ketosteroid isomerase-like protein
MGNGDVPGALGQLDPNVEWHEAENFVYADHSPYKGIDNLVNGLFMRLMTEWEGFKAIPEEFIASGDRVVVLGYYNGVFRETEKPVKAQMVHVYKVANGKIVHCQQHTDTAQFRDVTK